MPKPKKPPATVLEWAGTYRRRGVFPLPLKFNEKSYARAHIADKRLSLGELSEYFDGARLNVGLVLGDGLVQVDYDAPQAAFAAGWILPESWSVSLGDEGTRRTFYTVNPAKELVCKSPYTGVLVELKTKGCPYVPPSVIRNKQAVWHGTTFEGGLVAAPADWLSQRVRWLGGIALLAQLWPKLNGAHQDGMDAFCGALCRVYPVSEVELLCGTLVRTLLRFGLDSDEKERQSRTAAYKSTIANHALGKSVTGFQRLAQILEARQLNAAVPLLKDWFGLLPERTVGARTGAQRPPPQPEQVPLEDMQPSRIAFPVAALGGLLGDAAGDLAALQQVDTAFAAGCVLGAAALAAQGVADVVRPRSRSDMRARIPLSLFVFILAPSGERKTSTAHEALAGALAWMTRALPAHAQAVREYEAQRAAAKAARKDGAAVGDPILPRAPTVMYQDATFQAMVRGLHKEWPSALLFLPEAGVFLGGYSMSDTRMLALTGLSWLWDGRPYTLHRVSEGAALTLIGRRFSALLLAQPEVGKQLFNDSLAELQGLLSRVLPIYPRSLIGTRLLSPEGARQQDTPALNRFNTRCDELLCLGPKYMDQETGVLTVPEFFLEDEAVRLWIEAADRYESGLVEGGPFEGMADLTNKFPEQVLRIAGIRAVFEGVNDKVPNVPVTVEHIRGAVEIVDYFAGQWSELSGRLAATDKKAQQLQILAKWLRAQKAPVTVKHTAQHINRPVRVLGMPAIRQLLIELVGMGHAQLLPDGHFVAVAEQDEKI